MSLLKKLKIKPKSIKPDKSLEKKLLDGGFKKVKKIYYQKDKNYVFSFNDKVAYVENIEKKEAKKVYEALRVTYDARRMSKAGAAALTMPGTVLGGGIAAAYLISIGVNPVWGAVSIGGAAIFGIGDIMVSVFQEEKIQKRSKKLMTDYKTNGKMYLEKDAIKKIDEAIKA